MAKENGNRARYWTAVMYPESMIDDWKEVIADKLQVPGEYCVHDKDVDKSGELRKEHVHINVVFPNTTTYNHALSVFKEIGVVNKIERIINIRHAHDYLIHDTDNARKQGKYQYDKNERIEFNNYDIGAYEQLTVTDKLTIKKKLSCLIREKHFFNFDDFDCYVTENLELEYYQVLCENQGYFNNLVRGHYNKIKGIASGEYIALTEAIKKMETQEKE